MTATVIPFPIKPEAPDRTERFARELDAKLKTFPDDRARVLFLAALEARWTERFRCFLRNVDSGRYDEPKNGPSAFDYALTIAEISVRRTRVEITVQGAIS
jgi:hypothetical protein